MSHNNYKVILFYNCTQAFQWDCDIVDGYDSSNKYKNI